MKSRFNGVAMALAAGAFCISAYAAFPLEGSLVHGVFKPGPDTTGPGAIHPLPPLQKLVNLQDRSTFRAQDCASREETIFPVLAAPGTSEPSALEDFSDEGGTFLAAVDLTGSGLSDLIYTRKGMSGWTVLSNGGRMSKPAACFIKGFFEKDSGTSKTDLIPADNRNLIVDRDLLAVTGDFLGNGTEQLAYTRPGCNQIWVVGAHGVTAMKADLRGIEPAAPTAQRTHWLFPYRATRKQQRTRLAYYRMGADHLIRLVPKGMEFVQEKVPLKGHWERLSQGELDWPQAAPQSTAPPAQATAEGNPK